MKTPGSSVLSVNWQGIKPVLSLGVPAGLCLEFPEFKEAGLSVLARRFWKCES